MLFLNGSDIMKAVSLEDVMQAVSDAYVLFDKGTCCTPNRAFYAHEGNSLIYMPCFSPDALITKILSFFPENRKKGKPTLDGVVLWTDPDSGEILSILDAKKITALRTGAAGGLAVKYLSAPDSRTLGVVGAGMQGLHQALFAASVRKLEQIWLYDTYQKDAAPFEDSLAKMLGRRIPCRMCADTAELLKKSEIVIAATTSPTPVVPNDAQLLAGKCLISIGSFSPKMREFPQAVWDVTDTVYVDLEYAMEESGDLSQPLEEGSLKKEQVKKISTLIGGPVAAPANGKSTFFKTVGMALVDLTTAGTVYRNAVKKGIGQKLLG